MVESYLSSEVSYEELALANGISNHSMITRWVNEFRVAGPDALRPKKERTEKDFEYWDPLMDMCNGEILSYGIDVQKRKLS